MPRALLLLVAGLVACDPGDDPARGLFLSGVQEVALEVDYQEGIAPQTGPLNHLDSIWDLFVANASALFAAAPRAVTVPHTLEEMGRIQSPSAGSYSREEILAIADDHRDQVSSGARRVYHVVFLNAYLRENGRLRPDVLGTSIHGTGVIAMFAPAIHHASSCVVEQTVLIHEFGHAVGLVNNGLPMVEPHQDVEHGAHCVNPDCVMYRLNQGVKLWSASVQKYPKTHSSVLFCERCLQDAHAASRR
jgi:hypothetical protein